MRTTARPVPDEIADNLEAVAGQITEHNELGAQLTDRRNALIYAALDGGASLNAVAKHSGLTKTMIANLRDKRAA